MRTPDSSTPACMKLVERAPNGIRTRAAALKGRCPGPLDDGGLPSCSRPERGSRQSIAGPRSDPWPARLVASRRGSRRVRPVARGVFRRLGVQRPRRRRGVVHRGRHVCRRAVRRRVGRARRDRPPVDERRSRGRGVRLRGPRRRGRDRHRALERQGQVGGGAAPRRMGRHPGDHVRAGRDIPNAHVSSDVALQHVSRAPAEQEPAGTGSDHPHRPPRPIEEHDRDGDPHPERVDRSASLEQHRRVRTGRSSAEPSSPLAPGGRCVHAPSSAARPEGHERSHQANVAARADILLVGLAGFEPATRGLKAPCSRPG